MSVLGRVGSTPAFVSLAFTLALASVGCDKLKSAIHKDADGGTSLASGLSFLGSDFEGEISMNLTSKAKPMPPTQVVFGMKKPKYRIDTVTSGPAGQTAPGALIIDLPTKKGYALSPSQKTAVVIDFEKMKAMKGQIPGLPGVPKGATAPSTPPNIGKTGVKDVVAGYTCEIWVVTSEGKKADLCVAEGITWIDVGDIGLASPDLALGAVMTEANRFPLRVVTHDAKGAEEMRMEATKIEKKKLDDARFAVPPDYRVLDMSNLMGGIGGPGGVPSNLPSFKTH